MKSATTSVARRLRTWWAGLRPARSDAEPISPPGPTALAEQQEAPSSTPANTAGYVLLVRAVDADVASVARGVPGVTKVTRDVGGVWNIAADLNVSSAVARGIVSRGGSLQLLAGVKPGNQQALMQYVARDEP